MSVRPLRSRPLFALALLAHAAPDAFSGASAAAVLDATDGCETTRAWVWAGEEAEGDSAVLLYGVVWDTCKGRRVAELSGEARGVAFASGRRGATLDVDLPVEVRAVRSRQARTETMILHVDWAPGRDGGRTDALDLDWGAWRIGYPAGASFSPALAGGHLDGVALEVRWAYVFDAKGGLVLST